MKSDIHHVTQDFQNDVVAPVNRDVVQPTQQIAEHPAAVLQTAVQDVKGAVKAVAKAAILPTEDILFGGQIKPNESLGDYLLGGIKRDASDVASAASFSALVLAVIPCGVCQVGASALGSVALIAGGVSAAADATQASYDCLGTSVGLTPSESCGPSAAEGALGVATSAFDLIPGASEFLTPGATEAARGALAATIDFLSSGITHTIRGL